MKSAGHRAAQHVSPAKATGLSDALIKRLARSFYEKVKHDALIGPLFAERIDDWEAHLQKMCPCWSSVALMTGRYHSRLMEKYAALPVDARHFDRWLELFRETADDVCPPAAAAHVVQCPAWIVHSLEFGVATHRGIDLTDNKWLSVSPPRTPSSDD